jgi:hypothetical protein
VWPRFTNSRGLPAGLPRPGVVGASQAWAKGRSAAKTGLTGAAVLGRRERDLDDQNAERLRPGAGVVFDVGSVVFAGAALGPRGAGVVFDVGSVVLAAAAMGPRGANVALRADHATIVTFALSARANATCDDRPGPSVTIARGKVATVIARGPAWLDRPIGAPWSLLLFWRGRSVVSPRPLRGEGLRRLPLGGPSCDQRSRGAASGNRRLRCCRSGWSALTGGRRSCSLRSGCSLALLPLFWPARGSRRRPRVWREPPRQAFLRPRRRGSAKRPILRRRG